MENKEIYIDGVDVSGCEFYSYIESNKYPHRCSCYEDMYGASVVCNLTDCCKNCHYKNWQRKEQEYEELRQYHNKCCEENAKKLEEWLEKFNQVSRDFFNGKYCTKENCNLLKAKEQECERLKKYLNQIRDEELSHLDIEWDEYETSARQEDYSNIITLVERALGEIDD